MLSYIFSYIYFIPQPVGIILGIFLIILATIFLNKKINVPQTKNTCITNLALIFIIIFLYYLTLLSSFLGLPAIAIILIAIYLNKKMYPLGQTKDFFKANCILTLLITLFLYYIRFNPVYFTGLDQQNSLRFDDLINSLIDNIIYFYHWLYLGTLILFIFHTFTLFFLTTALLNIIHYYKNNVLNSKILKQTKMLYAGSLYLLPLAIIISISTVALLSYNQYLTNKIKSSQTSPLELKQLYTNQLIKFNYPKLILFANNPNTPIEILTKLVNTHNKHVLRALAENPSTPSSTLIILSEKGYRDTIINLNFTNAPPKIFDSAAERALTDWRVFESLWKNPSPNLSSSTRQYLNLINEYNKMRKSKYPADNFSTNRAPATMFDITMPNKSLYLHEYNWIWDKTNNQVEIKYIFTNERVVDANIEKHKNYKFTLTDTIYFNLLAKNDAEKILTQIKNKLLIGEPNTKITNEVTVLTKGNLQLYDIDTEKNLAHNERPLYPYYLISYYLTSYTDKNGLFHTLHAKMDFAKQNFTWEEIRLMNNVFTSLSVKKESPTTTPASPAFTPQDMILTFPTNK